MRLTRQRQYSLTLTPARRSTAQHSKKLGLLVLSMNAPWIRDMEESERNVSRTFRWIVALIVSGMICAAVFFLCSCSTLTVAPHQVVARTVAPSGNNFNSGVIDCDNSGCLVDGHWMAKYNFLVKKYGNKLSSRYAVPPKGILEIGQEGHNYRVTYELYNRFIELRRIEGDNQP